MPSAPVRPTIAVVIPVFHAQFLGEALASVFDQTRRPDEVIVIDDGSPDRRELGLALARWGRGVRVFRQPNSGAGAARNRGIRAARTDFVAFLDADDRWRPAHLETQLSELALRRGCDVVYANAVYVGDTPLSGRRFMDVCPSRGPLTATALLALQCHVPLSTVVARRQVLVDAGLFDERLRRGQDFDLWLRLALHGVRFHHHEGVSMEHRIHGGNLSGSSAMRMQRAAGVFRKALAELPLSAPQRALAARQVSRFESAVAVEDAKALIGRGDFAAARAALSRARQAADGWKVGAALLGLRVAPHLVRRVYLARGLQGA